MQYMLFILHVDIWGILMRCYTFEIAQLNILLLNIFIYPSRIQLCIRINRVFIHYIVVVASTRIWDVYNKY